jgi:predicted small metal-binding protein
MKILSCNAVSGLSCPYAAQGETNEEVMEKLKRHGSEVHPEEIKKMMEGISAEQLLQKMQENIKEE